MDRMNKGFIISFGFLLISAIAIILFIINKIFFPISWIESLTYYVEFFLLLIFYDISIYFYGVSLIAYVLLLPLFVLGYNLSKTKQLTGSILYVSSLFGFAFITFIIINYNYVGLLFNVDLSLTTRLSLILLFLPVNFAFSFVLFLASIDQFIFLKDLVQARKVWNHKLLNYDIETKGKMTYINIETNEHIFTPIPMLIIAKYLQTEGYSIAWFVKGAFNHLFSLIITYLTGWPRARNVLFRLLGLKIGDNCHISERTVIDPLLPELIEFENGSGCGIGVKLFTHNAMNIKHGSFSFGPIKVCENARIGAYSLILPGVTIGKGSIIGANSVVTEDIPPYSIAHGSPARIIREMTEEEKEEVNKQFELI